MSGEKEEAIRYITIEEKKKCCGCGACVNACGQDCISMEMDEEGFFYPYIDQTLCINCGLCVTKCHMINEVQNENKHKIDCYAAYNKDENKMLEGSSGGIFESLCDVVCNMQGVIYGAVLDDGLVVKHQRALTMEQAKRFRKSKYLQSDIGNTFSMAKKDLEEGRMVLFSGTPCQVGGLYGYLGKQYDKLYTVDIVCHGVPSNRVFKKYLGALEKKYNSTPISICWRDKRDGWGPNKVSVKLENGQEIINKSSSNAMQFGFLNNLYLRPSCYECNYAHIPRIADITLGDFWGYDGALLTQNQNRGISMVAVSSKKGKEMFEKIRFELIIEQVDIEYCKNKSYHFDSAPIWNSDRNNFMKEFREGKNFIELARKYLYGGSSTNEFDLFGLKDIISECESGDVTKECTVLPPVGNTIYKGSKL